MGELATQKRQGIASYLNSEQVKSNIVSTLGERDSQAFIASVVSAVQTNPELAECTKKSILSAALLGHSLKLPQSPQLAMFYMVPYKNKRKDENGREVTVKEAQFQIGYRGLLLLASRSGQYKRINATAIKDGELVSYNPITEEYEFNAITDYEEREKLPTVGFYAYFLLNNGYKKELYWSKERMESHAKKYSYAYRNGWTCLWKTDFESMALKTMIRMLISKWGPMSVEMEKAYTGDMAVIGEDGTPEYVDNVEDSPIEAVDVYAQEIAPEQGGNDGTE